VTDEEIVSLVILGEKERFSELMERYEEKLVRYVAFLLNKKTEDTEDLVAETFIKAYQNLPGFEKDKKFSSWIYRIAHNLVIDYFRKNKIKEKKLLEEEWQEIGDELLIEDEIIKIEEKEKLGKALGKLNLEEKNLVRWFYFEEKGYEEIGDILRISIGNVGVKLNRAKKKLKKLMEKENER